MTGTSLSQDDPWSEYIQTDSDTDTNMTLTENWHKTDVTLTQTLTFH